MKISKQLWTFKTKEESMSKKLVIVGGGAAGPSIAAEAKRRDPSLQVTMIERGEFVSYAA
jgi:glycine/D-amino acid oxidase-like deaminating enzyme